MLVSRLSSVIGLLLLLAACDGHLERFTVKEQTSTGQKAHRHTLYACGQDVVETMRAVAGSLNLVASDRGPEGAPLPDHTYRWQAVNFFLTLERKNPGLWRVDLADFPDSSQSVLSIRVEREIRKHFKTACYSHPAATPGGLAAEPSSYILRADMGARLLRQCSRQAPENVKDFFTPETSQVAELEAALGPYLNSVRPALQFQRYDRQYVGFIKDGRRYIYGNFFTNDIGTPDPRSGPVIVCDGGEASWGVVYSLDSKTLQDLRINGI